MGRPYISVAKKGDGADFKGAAKGCEKNRKNRIIEGSIHNS